MPSSTRSPEERQAFFDARNAIVVDLTEVRDHDPRTDADLNAKALMVLGETLETCGEGLISICSHLAKVALERGEIKMGPSNDAPTRAITLADIATLRVAIYEQLKDVPRESEDPAHIALRRGASRLNAVNLFYHAIHGGVYRYSEKDRNGISVERQRRFGGIPDDKMLPRRVIDKRNGPLTFGVSIIDWRITPETARHIYETLRELEAKNPVVALPLPPDHGNLVSVTLHRAGEAALFWSRLPKGLKEPREKKVEDAPEKEGES